jgi:hypothetical protein
MKPELLELRQLYEDYIRILSNDTSRAQERIVKHQELIRDEEIHIEVLTGAIYKYKTKLTELNKKIEG